MSGRGWETLPNVRECSGGPPVCPGVVERLSQLSGSGGRPSGCPGVVGCPSRKFKRSARRSGNSRETLPDVPEGWETLLDIW